MLAHELHQLVGWGASEHRLALYPTLRGLADVDHLGLIPAGTVLRSLVRDAILSISEPVELWGNTYTPEVIRRCLLILYRFELSAHSATNRRYRVVSLLGLHVTVDTWRRAHTGYERRLIEVLALRLLEYQTSANSERRLASALSA